MPMHNSEIADSFERLADLLEIESANPFRVRAYRNAARTVRGYPRGMSDLLEDGEDLSELPDIGKDLAEKIHVMVETGKLPLLEEVESRTPPALSELMKIEGLGAIRVKTLYKKLKVKSLDDLKTAAQDGKIREVSGFGEKSEEKIRKHIERYAGGQERTKLMDAEDIAKPLVEYLKKAEGIKDIIIAGSYRRRKETVGDLDILVTAKRGLTGKKGESSIMGHFTDYDEVDEVVSKGKTRSTVYLRSGMQVDLRVVPQVSYGAAQHYFTGSKSHNIAVRTMGVKKGYKINEYGVFKGGKRIAGETEKSVYEKVGLPYIPPELRESRGELDAAKEGKLPKLITLEDIRGNLHTHTKATDGRNTLKEMAQAASELGYEYLGITDHSKRLTVAKGLNKKRLLEQIEEIDKLNEKLDDIVLLKSIEVDILEDGSLDLPDSVLKKLDYVVGSIHHKFDLSRKKQTERILKAMDNDYFSILGHPSGRLINERDAYEIDLEKVLRGARDSGCFIELNAQPERLDLTDDGCKMAKEMGVKISIATDAHSSSNLNYMRFGVDQARRGWLEAKDVINCRSLKELKKLFKK
ncbi:DNA polymerase/3'-5' exonuclease PolX [Microbulbifer rhizosphaerae]|uniref:DNA polymerase beta n=1 Tax=Microbulbifer rhizosphaerae TaxID=1562603 RepID=A0A7W4WBA6_9GAMM|nr:DNA polymerase/3'-5' exonuclease PolX [Microbulbifer rhizosphaerae]MBB3060909.1 DNA polymerase (family 10) [Microbulbifer rhizosphaerae]